ncbi:hypothetical protein ABH931_005553 [Streptacidiphilus sp. MAP12-33]|uniref:hypothetical protein n=1 Tax=Streptacidiphilus sp. MAP12-33 TaxID=3156266 RepID=UPI003514D3EF
MLIGLLIVVAVVAVLVPVAVDRAQKRRQAGGHPQRPVPFPPRDGLSYLPDSDPTRMPWTDPGLPGATQHHGGHHHGGHQGVDSHHSQHHGHHDSGSSWSGSSGSSDFGGGHHHG